MNWLKYLSTAISLAKLLFASDGKRKICLICESDMISKTYEEGRLVLKVYTTNTDIALLTFFKGVIGTLDNINSKLELSGKNKIVIK